MLFNVQFAKNIISLIVGGLCTVNIA